MPKTTLELKVFLASPNDVAKERARARQLLQLTNDAVGETRGIHLKVVGWEDVPSELGDPQGLVNRFSEGADLVVVIFARRFGTPTSGYPSGTLEEFTRAKERWQQRGSPRVMLFFKDLDRKDIDDPGPQLTQVLQFRTTFQNDRTGFFNTFSDVDDFGAKFQKHLLHWLEQFLPNQWDALPSPQEHPPAVEQDVAISPHPVDPTERRIEEIRQAAHSVFTPSSPVLEPRFLFAREKYLKWIARTRRMRGTSIVLYGPPASGKTSLLKLLENQEQALYRPAREGHTWAFIARSILEELGISTSQEDREDLHQNPFRRVDPDEAAQKLSSSNRLVMVDAFDKINQTERLNFTDFIKMLSDRQSHLTMLFAGEAEGIEDLIPKYQSVKRHLIAFRLQPLSQGELEMIIDQGFQSLGIEIHHDAKQYIISRSLGLAHMVHQYCIDCVYALEERIRNEGKQELTIDMAECELAEIARPTVG